MSKGQDSLHAQGPTTDSPYEPGEHIPGLNVGGWHDAGDWDIRTQTQYATIGILVQARETFRIDWNQTSVERLNRRVNLRRPDGVPDILQQIEHGAIALLAQYRAIGHAIPGIIVPTIDQGARLIYVANAARALLGEQVSRAAVTAPEGY